MSNLLIKDPPVVEVVPGVDDDPDTPGAPGQPGSPGVPGQEERYETVQYVYPNFFGVPLNPRDVQLREIYIFPQPMGLYVWKPLYFRANGKYANIDVRMIPSAEQFWSYTLHYHYVAPIPPIPPVPPGEPPDDFPGDTTEVDEGFGWDKSAFSVPRIAAPYRAAFRIPDTVVGAACGVQFETGLEGQWKLDGFKIEKGELVPIVGGLEVGLPAYYPHAADALLEIVMVNNYKLWRVDGVPVLAVDLQYEAPDSPVQVFLGGMLYAPGDSIYDPYLGRPDMGTIVFRGPEALGGDTYEFGEVEFRPLRVTGGMGHRVTFEPMAVLGGEIVQGGALVMRVMYAAGWADSFGPPVASGGAVSLLPMRIAGAAGRGVGNFRFRAMDVRGGIMRQGAVEFPAPFLLGFGGFETATDADMSWFADASSSAAPTRITLADMPSSFVFTVTLNPALVADSSALSTVLATDPLTVQALLGAMARSTVDIGEATPPFEDPGNVWVVNAKTGAVSTYVEFPFNSYARIGDAYYGLKADGLYLLEGDTDAAATILANVNFGQLDFGTTALKRVTDVYIGIASTGKLMLKVTANGQSYLYQQQRATNEMQVQRFVPGRGLQGLMLTFELYNTDNTDFEMSSIEFAAVPLTRRI